MARIRVHFENIIVYFFEILWCNISKLSLYRYSQCVRKIIINCHPRCIFRKCSLQKKKLQDKKKNQSMRRPVQKIKKKPGLYKTIVSHAFNMNPNIIPVVYPAATETEPMMTRNERMERANLSQRYPMQRHTIQRYPVQRYPAQECPVQRYINLSINERPSFFMSRPLVRAAGLLNENSMTEIIDVNTLPQKNTSIIRNVCIQQECMHHNHVLQFSLIFETKSFLFPRVLFIKTRGNKSSKRNNILQWNDFVRKIYVFLSSIEQFSFHFNISNHNIIKHYSIINFYIKINFIYFFFFKISTECEAKIHLRKLIQIIFRILFYFYNKLSFYFKMS